MAKQTKHLIALSDVKTVFLQCIKCGSSMAYAFTWNGRIPVSCQVCGSDWRSTVPSTDLSAMVVEFMRLKWGLEQTLKEHVTSLGCTMSLEVDIEEPAAAPRNSGIS